METATERKERGRLLPLDAMRGTAVGSFLFGSVNPHAPHTHIFIQLFSQNAWVFLGGVMMEANNGDTSMAPRSSPTDPDLPLSSCFVRLPIPPPSTPAWLPQGCPAIKWLPDPVVFNRGWGHCTGRMPWVCGQWRHGERGREEWLYFGIDTEVFSLFSPSFLWFYGLLTSSRLSSGHERRSLADLLQRFWQGLQEERDLQQGWTGWPRGTCKFWGNLTPLGGLLRSDCAQNTRDMASEYFKTGCKKDAFMTVTLFVVET